MFRCYFCHQVTPPKTTRHSVVIEARTKQYSARRREQKRRNFRDRDRDRDDSVQDRGGSGIEIIKEVDACPACAAKQKQVEPVTPTEVTSQETLVQTSTENSGEAAAE